MHILDQRKARACGIFWDTAAQLLQHGECAWWEGSDQLELRSHVCSLSRADMHIQDAVPVDEIQYLGYQERFLFMKFL